MATKPTPVLDRIERRRPLLGRVARFFTSYAKKATVTSVAGTVITDTLLNNIGIGEEAGDTVIGWLAGLPWWVQLPALAIGFFALPYLPGNNDKK